MTRPSAHEEQQARSTVVRPVERSRLLLRFGEFELALRSLELYRRGEPQPLAPQPARALSLLARNAGELVTHRDLREELWGSDVNVEADQCIHACIKQVRAALGDSAADSRYIKTLPRRGYRFQVAVDVVKKPVAMSATPTPCAPDEGSQTLADDPEDDAAQDDTGSEPTGWGRGWRRMLSGA